MLRSILLRQVSFLLFTLVFQLWYYVLSKYTKGAQPAMDEADALGPFSNSSSGSATDDEAQPPAEVGNGFSIFDPAVAARHEYLGEFDDVHSSGECLEEGATYTLPLFMLEGVVMLPGSSLPMILATPTELTKLLLAMHQAVPCARIIAVTHWSRRTRLCHSVGCSAEVRRLRYESDGSVHLVARARQRLYLTPASLSNHTRVQARVLGEGPTGPVPREIRDSCGYQASWVACAFDLKLLAERAQRLCSGVLPPEVSEYQCGPLQYSYWLAANLPLNDAGRPKLLEAPHAAARLLGALRWLKQLGRLYCVECGEEIARSGDAILMTQEGVGSAFVNAHGYVHDMATFRAVRGIQYHGRPETEHSWFPGYAWTICNCGGCNDHLGWRFTAVQPGLSPGSFWGLRRPALVSTRGAHGEGDGPEGAESTSGSSAADSDLEAESDPEGEGLGLGLGSESGSDALESGEASEEIEVLLDGNGNG